MSLLAAACQDIYVSSVTASEEAVRALLREVRNMARLIGTEKTAYFTVHKGTNTLVHIDRDAGLITFARKCVRSSKTEN